MEVVVLEFVFESGNPVVYPLVCLAAFIHFIECKPDKMSVNNGYGRGKGIAGRADIVSKKMASAVFQVFVKYTHAIAKGVGVGLRVATAKEGNGLVGQVGSFQGLYAVVPVILQLAIAPGRGAQYQYVVLTDEAGSSQVPVLEP